MASLRNPVTDVVIVFGPMAEQVTACAWRG